MDGSGEGRPGEGRAGDFRADVEKCLRIAFGQASSTRRQRLLLYATHLGLHCVAVYRFHRWTRRFRRRHGVLGVPFHALGALLTHGMLVVYKVHVGADVGPGFFIGHVGNIYLGAQRIGRNFSVAHNVTLGRGHALGPTSIPIVGDDVWIGTGAVLAGDLRVGDGVTIASGTILSRSVPDHALVAGNPGRVALTRFDNRLLFAEPEQPPSDAPPSEARPSDARPSEVPLHPVPPAEDPQPEGIPPQVPLRVL
jgi:serine O-acetyltransferase